MTTRRTFLGALAASGIGAALSRALPVSAAVPVAQRVARSDAPDAPDAGGFLRLGGWAVCVPPQELAQHGQWVIDGVFSVLQPARWHTWGIWPATNTVNRVPGIFSDQYFNRPAVRQYMTDHPACEWLGFNEPEVASQANMTPELAADVTREFIELGWEVGSEFQWLSPSVTLDTSSDGLGWLTEYMLIMRRHAIMRPSSWGIHPYNCNTVAALRQSMAKWWAWYEVWGSGAPTVITEVCAQGENVAGQKLVMDECKAMLQRKEVSGISWASAYKGTSDGTNWQHYALTLLNHETQTVTLTELGRRWKELQQWIM